MPIFALCPASFWPSAKQEFCAKGGAVMKLYEICFSPAGGTKKVADLLVRALGGEPIVIDLTDPDTKFQDQHIAAEDLAVIALPSYGGRVPALAAQRLSYIKGAKARAVLVCVYGGRAFEDTLVEMEDLAKSAGFQVVAAVAALAQHSIVGQLCTGRPDEQDADNLRKFGEEILQKLSQKKILVPKIPGNRPYKIWGGSAMVPRPNSDCVSCGLCAAKCPVRAIQADDPAKVDEKACISCMRCVAICPTHARQVAPEQLKPLREKLLTLCKERKECELFL